LTTTDYAGKVHNADPIGNYHKVVQDSVKLATDAGFIVILELHFNCPDTALGVPGAALGQQPMADMDHSVAFWTSIANTFKSNSSVIFELYNEPFFWWIAAGVNPWQVLRDGGTIQRYMAYGPGAQYHLPLNWLSAGTQTMLTAIRATGATNVVLTPGIDWCQDLASALQYLPVDPLKQLGQTWHCYPNPTTPDTPKDGIAQYTYATGLRQAGIPVILTETGEHNAAGTVGAPLMGKLLPWADTNGISVLGWGFNPWGNPDNVLIKDTTGTPTDGYGKAFHDWLVNHG
jgi:hypothetical protein